MWSKAQIKLHGIAASKAGWDHPQRYLALRHAGCPVRSRGDRPSATHPRNSQGSFEAYMALAEGVALSLGVTGFPRPRRGSWFEAANNAARRTHRLIRQVEAELIEKVPHVFHRGFLTGFINDRMLKNEMPTDRDAILGAGPRSVEDLDAGQAYRVLEGLKAWGGRELHKRGLTARSFRASPGMGQRTREVA